jgi:hypothetical protein
VTRPGPLGGVVRAAAADNGRMDPSLSFDATVTALRTLVGRDVWITVGAPEAAVAAFSHHLKALEERGAGDEDVQEARLDFGTYGGVVFLRRPEHRGTRRFADGALHVDLGAYTLALEAA